MKRMRRWGLRAKMSASYVLVTAAAVVVALTVALFVLQPLAAPPTDASLTVQFTARDYATMVADAHVRLGRMPTAEDIRLGEPGLRVEPGTALYTQDDPAVRIPFVDTELDDSRPMTLALLLDPELRIVSSSYPARYPVGARVGGPGVAGLPMDAIVRFSSDAKPNGGRTEAPNGEVLWALAPVYPEPLALSKGDGKSAGKPIFEQRPLGVVYVQAPATPELMAAAGSASSDTPLDNLGVLFGIGLLVLIGALPVGVVFGMLATRPLIRRLRRLAASTVAVADGQYQHRVPVSGGDEIATLEGNFNRMAAQLSAAMAAERHLASAGERARIARELHDSISQDLFSLRLLAGGLRRALPAASPLSPQIEAMERTATGTMHEMQALLLELRPVALQDAGLVAALEELCRAYTDRLGVAVHADVEAIELAPAIEHAVLRIVQEALANAVKHARPNRITVRMRGAAGRVAVSVTDDGAGFDPAAAAERHGMGLELMRERTAELGGTFHLDSTPGRGAEVRVELPRRWP